MAGNSQLAAGTETYSAQGHNNQFWTLLDGIKQVITKRRLLPSIEFLTASSFLGC
jgi:hypothetical protein